MTKKTRFYYLLFTGIAISVISLVLGLFHLLWWYFTIGAILGVLLHLLMEIQNKRFYRISSDKLQREFFSPKKDTILWYVLRLVIIGVVFVLIVLLTMNYYPDRLLEVSLLFLIPYIVIKIIFILIICLEGRR